MDDFNISYGFPTLITPKTPTQFETSLSLLNVNKQGIEKLLLKQGALFFRGFQVSSADDFSQMIEVLNFGEFVNYIAGDSPRDKVKNKVYTSTEAPAKFHLPLHQELSYIKHFPQHIYFYCEVPSGVGGETIIADARAIYRDLDKDLIKRFEQKGLMYISRYYHRDKIMKLLNRFVRSHKSWAEVFETDNKEEVESLCQKHEIEIVWLKNNWLEMRQIRPALHTHPITNETVWFNQAHLYDFNPKLLGKLRYLGAKLFYARKNTLLHEIRYADGSKIARSDLYHVLEVLDRNTVAFPWQKGDVMILDNILAMHGRAPFQGKRRILTALTKN